MLNNFSILITGGNKIAADFTYYSDNNIEWMSIDALLNWIEQNRENIGKI